MYPCSELRRKFEAEPLRRMNNAARAYCKDPHVQSKLARLEKLHKAKALRANQVNPKSQTPNPKSQTLNPKTLNRARSRT